MATLSMGLVLELGARRDIRLGASSLLQQHVPFLHWFFNGSRLEDVVAAANWKLGLMLPICGRIKGPSPRSSEMLGMMGTLFTTYGYDYHYFHVQSG